MESSHYRKALHKQTQRLKTKIKGTLKTLVARLPLLSGILQNRFVRGLFLSAYQSRYALSGLTLTAVMLVLGIRNLDQHSPIQASLAGNQDVTLDAFPIQIPHLRYGFALDTFQVTEGSIQPNEFLGSLLQEHGLSSVEIQELVQNAEGIFDIKSLRTGKPYTFLAKAGKEKPDYFIYEPNVYVYYVFDLNGKSVKRVERPVQKKWKTALGKIETSLWNAMTEQGLDYALAAKMEDALQWSVDFHHLQKGDRFQLLYEQEYINGRPVGIGQVYVAHYQTGDNEFYSIWYDENKELQGYYDLEGRPMNKGFLKAPVKFSRISSRFNPSRLHPILKRRRPHLGTDYAAPYGTPIMAVGNGVVVEARYSRGGGNMIKIKHNETYSTRYLHMQKFASGIRAGTTVKQGQIIGYVGSTGLATGPHVHFEFLKNGHAVDHTKLSFPPPDPLPESELPKFFELRDQYMKILNGGS